MGLLGKLQILFILLSVGIGLFLGHYSFFSTHGDKAILPFLLSMLTIVFLQIPLANLRKAFANFRFSGFSLGVNFIWTPVFAWLLGKIFLMEYPDLWIGFIMLMVTPCTDWYLIFTQLAGGKVSLAATLLPWHLILQLLLLPLYLLIFADRIVSIDTKVLLESIFFVLIIPIIMAIIIRILVLRSKGEKWLDDVFLPAILPFQLVFLCLAITAMFSSQGKELINNPIQTLHLLPPLLSFYSINLIIGLYVSKLAGIDRLSTIGFCFSILARNSPVALAIAVMAFPNRPLIPLALVIGPLIELPTLAIFVQFFKWREAYHLKNITIR
jgi:ACR3 family arsenite transporter